MRVAREMHHSGHRGRRDGPEEKGFGSGSENPSCSVFCVLCVLCVLWGSVLSCASNAPKAGVGSGAAALAAPAVNSPSGPSAEVYTTLASPAVATDPLAEQLAAEIDGGRRNRGQTPLVRDGRLDHVAHDIVLLTGGRRPPAPDAVAFLLWHYGVVEPEPNLFLLRGDDGAEATAMAALQPQFAAASASTEWRRVGIAVVRTAGQWAAVVVFQEKNLDIEPVPRRLASGTHTDVVGRMRALFRSPEVLVTPPRGAVERLATTVHHDAYSARLDCNSGSGVYQVEISAQDTRGPRVLANFPVYCGIAPPTTFVFAGAEVSRATDPGEAERQLLDLLDRDRKANGLPALARDARLAAVARRYSDEMAATGEVAHVSPRTGSVIERVSVAGVTPMPNVIAENVGSAASATDAEHAFMGSPGHRDNILNGAVTHVGVGVALGREEGGTVPLFFTQIFAGWGK
jgi:uncharacterized protein YkwD